MSVARVPRMPGIDRRELPGLAAVTVLSALRAVGIVLIAQSLAASIAALASGGTGWRDALLLGAVGAVVRAGAGWAVSSVAAREAVAAKSRLRRELIEDVAEGGAAGRDGGSTAVLATTGLDDLDEYYGAVIPSAVSAVVVPLVLGARILSVDGLSALIIAVTVPLIPVFMVLIGMHSRDRADAVASSLARLSDHLVELARGLPVLVGLGRVEEQTLALDAVQREWRVRTSRMLRTAFLSALALELVATLSVAVVAVVLGLRLLDGSIGLEVALLVLLLAPDCFSALREVGAAFHSAQDGRAARRRVRELVDAAPSSSAAAAAPSEGAGVRLRGVTVRYPGRAHPVLSHLSLDLPPNTVTAVTAPSGGGKSTLLAVLAGTAAREVEVSGEIADIDPARLAYLAQVPTFFGETVAEEVSLWAAAGTAGAGADTPSRDVLRSAFVPAAVADARENERRSQSESEVGALPLLRALGLAEMGARRISELSPGERRRLAVARAAARVEAGATVVLLDEPTAHLDPESAAGVREVIRGMRRRAAVLLVSHDEATIGVANRVIELAAGREVVPTASETPGSSTAAERSSAPEMIPTAGAVATADGGVLRALFAPSRGRWALALLLGVSATGFGLALTAVSAWLIVRAAEHPAIMYLSVAIVGVRFFGLGRSVARYAERLVTHAALFAATDALRLRVWRAIAARGAGSRRLLEGGSAIDYLVTSIDQLRELVPRVVTPALVGALSLAGIVLTVALVDPSAAPLVGGGLLAALAVAVVVADRVDGSATGHRIDARSLLVRRVVAFADAATELRANGLSRPAVDRVLEADAALASDDRRAARSAGLGSALLSLLTAAVAVLVPVLTGSGSLGADVPAESVAVVALLALASLDPLTELLRAGQRVPALRAVLTRLEPFAPPVPPHPTPASSPVATPAATVPPAARLELVGLAARWPGAEHPVFTGLNAQVDRGDWLVVEGPSGSGKSTLLSVLMGAIEPADGSVHPAHPRVAWCPQDAHVFDSTIRGNLLLARPREDPVDDEEMREVLERVGLGELLARLPDGLSSRVGAGGGALSGGERQRLAVARALLGRAELLLLDEPTAHLDAPTAAAMMAELRAATRDRIVVLVTHRAEDRLPGDRTLRLGDTADNDTADSYSTEYEYEKSPA